MLEPTLNNFSDEGVRVTKRHCVFGGGNEAGCF